MKAIPKYFSRKIIYHTLTFSVYNPLTHKEEHIFLKNLLSYGMLSLWMLLLTNILGFFLVNMKCDIFRGKSLQFKYTILLSQLKS